MPATVSLSEDLQQRLATLASPRQPAGRAVQSRPSAAQGTNHARAQPKSFASERVRHVIAGDIQYDSQTLVDQVEGLALIERRLRAQAEADRLGDQVTSHPATSRPSAAHGAIHARAQPKSFAPGRVGHAIADHVQFDSQALADPVKGHALIERRLRMQEAEHQLGDQAASLPAASRLRSEDLDPNGPAVRAPAHFPGQAIGEQHGPGSAATRASHLQRESAGAQEAAQRVSNHVDVTDNAEDEGHVPIQPTSQRNSHQDWTNLPLSLAGRKPVASATRESAHQQQEKRVAELEAAIQRLSKDVQITKAPFPARQPMGMAVPQADVDVDVDVGAKEGPLQRLLATVDQIGRDASSGFGLDPVPDTTSQFAGINAGSRLRPWSGRVDAAEGESISTSPSGLDEFLRAAKSGHFDFDEKLTASSRPTDAQKPRIASDTQMPRTATQAPKSNYELHPRVVMKDERSVRFAAQLQSQAAVICERSARPEPEEPVVTVDAETELAHFRRTAAELFGPEFDKMILNPSSLDEPRIPHGHVNEPCGAPGASAAAPSLSCRAVVDLLGQRKPSGVAASRADSPSAVAEPRASTHASRPGGTDQSPAPLAVDLHQLANGWQAGDVWSAEEAQQCVEALGANAAGATDVIELLGAVIAMLTSHASAAHSYPPPLPRAPKRL